MATNDKVCPVVGTTNTVLPPSHPDIDLSKPGQTCPVVGAKTEHHGQVVHKHPATDAPTTTNDATACPVANRLADSSQGHQLDEKVCPVVGPVTTVLPPDHPTTEGKADDAVCPVTKASLGHHKGKVVTHPDVAGAGSGAVCPVVGARA